MTSSSHVADFILFDVRLDVAAAVAAIMINPKTILICIHREMKAATLIHKTYIRVRSIKVLLIAGRGGGSTCEE